MTGHPTSVCGGPHRWSACRAAGPGGALLGRERDAVQQGRAAAAGRGAVERQGSEVHGGRRGAPQREGDLRPRAIRGARHRARGERDQRAGVEGVRAARRTGEDADRAGLVDDRSAIAAARGGQGQLGRRVERQGRGSGEPCRGQALGEREGASDEPLRCPGGQLDAERWRSREGCLASPSATPQARAPGARSSGDMNVPASSGGGTAGVAGL